MAREQTLNDPLSGAEIKQIAVRKFAEALDRDCTLTDDIQYPEFDLEFSGRIRYPRSNTPSTQFWGKHRAGLAVNGGPDTEAVVEAFSGKYEAKFPDGARHENDLPIPVMVQTPSGLRREKVKFQVPSAYAKKASGGEGDVAK